MRLAKKLDWKGLKCLRIELIEELGEHGNDLVHSIKMWDVLAK
jgi:DNA-binding MurR/RpiR family transcriptional regulator